MTRLITISTLLLLLIIPTFAWSQISEVDKLVSSGWENYRQGLYRKAIQDFSAAKNLDASNSSAVEGIGAAALQMKNWPKAKDGFEAAHRLSPGDCSIVKNLAYVYMRLNLRDRAQEYYEKVVGLPGKPGCEPGDIASKSSLGALYYGHSKNEAMQAKALQLFNQILNEEDVDSTYLERTHYYLGTLYLKKKSYDLAISNLEKAYEMNPEKKEGRYNIGRLYFNKKEYEKSLAHLLIAYEDKGNDYNLNLMLGLCYKEMGRQQRETAITHLAQARNLMQLLDKTPRNLPHQQLAELYNKVKDFNKAIETSDEGLRLVKTPTAKAGLNCTKGKGLEGKKKHEAAIDIFEKAIDDPTWGNYALKQIERQESFIARKKARE